MSLMTWEPSLAVGYAPIDEQHERLVDILNRLNDAMKIGKGREIIGGVLTDLADYTVYHFSFEEELMDRHGIADSAQHKALHKAFIARLKGYKADFEAGSLAVAVDVLSFLADWLRNHFKKADTELAIKLNEMGA